MEIVNFRNLHKIYCCFYKNTSKHRIEKINHSRLSILFGASIFTRKIMRILRRSSLIGTHTRLENIYILAGCLLSGATLLNTNWHTDTQESIEYKLRITGCEIIVQDDMSAFDEKNVNRLPGIIYISLSEIFTPAVEQKCHSLATYLSPLDALERTKSDSNIQRMLNQQMKESNNIPPDTMHFITFSSGSDSDHPKASKIKYQHLRSCFERLETMGKWDDKEPLILLIANPVYEPFTSILLSYSLYRPNTTLHLLQRYTVTYWKILWEMNEYYKHVYNDSTYKIFTCLYPRQLEALLTLEQVAKECSIFDPIINYEYIVPIPPQENIEAVSEQKADEGYSQLGGNTAENCENVDDCCNTNELNLMAEHMNPKSPDCEQTIPSNSDLPAADTSKFLDAEQPNSFVNRKVFIGESAGTEYKLVQVEEKFASGSGELDDSKNINKERQNDSNQIPPFPQPEKSFFRLNKFDFKGLKSYRLNSFNEGLFSNRIKSSLLDHSAGFKHINWSFPHKQRLFDFKLKEKDKIEKSESNLTYLNRDSMSEPVQEKRSESLNMLSQGRKSSTYIPKLRMKFSELRSVLADKNVIFSLGGAPICPETCFTFSNVCKGKISILYYCSTETVFPLIYSESRIRETDDLLNTIKMGWAHEYHGLPCQGHYLGRPFSSSDGIKIVKSIDKSTEDFMIECDPGEPGFIICKANLNCELFELRIHDGYYLGLDDIGFYLYAKGNGANELIKEFFWMHKVDLSLYNYSWKHCSWKHHSWKLRPTQTSRLMHEYICKFYKLPWNKVNLKMFWLLHENLCIYCCAVELVRTHVDSETFPEPDALDLDEISKDISENLLSRCGQFELFSGLVLPDVLRVVPIPSTYKGTPDIRALKDTFKRLIYGSDEQLP